MTHTISVAKPQSNQLIFDQNSFSQGLAQFRFGPEEVLANFPVAILSKSLDLLHEIAGESTRATVLNVLEPEPMKLNLAILGVTLNLSRKYWGQEHTEPVEIVSIQRAGVVQSYLLRCQNGLHLGLPGTRQSFSVADETTANASYFLGNIEQHPQFNFDSCVVRESVPVFDELKNMLSWAIDQKILFGSPALIFPGVSGDRQPLREVAMKILNMLKNSPYNPGMLSGSEQKTRFKLIEAINTGDNPASQEFVMSTISRRPILVEMPGWCGGISLHKLAQLGHTSLLEKIFQYVNDEPSGGSVNNLLARRDADGSTPIHLAKRYQQQQSFELLEQVGSPKLVDRYGFRPG